MQAGPEDITITPHPTGRGWDVTANTGAGRRALIAMGYLPTNAPPHPAPVFMAPEEAVEACGAIPRHGASMRQVQAAGGAS
jgi:hypothetical protein